MSQFMNRPDQAPPIGPDPIDPTIDRDALKQTFGASARAYHRSRPSYPAALVARVVGAREHAGLRILEIGCGSGQATGLFAEHAVELTAIDISSELISIAERELGHFDHVRFIVGAFETFELPSQHFHLLFSAQAFHWIDPSIALCKANDLLAPGGRIALFWSYCNFEATAPLCEACSIILEYAPSFARWPDSSDHCFQRYAAEWRGALDETGYFQPAQVSVVPWLLSYRPDEFLDWIRSLSWFQVLPEPARSALISRLESAAVGVAPRLEVPVRVLLITADKAGG